MNERHEFDDLARRKLDEQVHPFNEADWSAAKQLIDAQKGSRGAWWKWVTAAAGLFLLGTGAWWLLQAPSSSPLASNTIGSPTHADVNAPIAPEVIITDVTNPVETIAPNAPAVNPTAAPIPAIAQERNTIPSVGKQRSGTKEKRIAPSNSESRNVRATASNPTASPTGSAAHVKTEDPLQAEVPEIQVLSNKGSTAPVNAEDVAPPVLVDGSIELGEGTKPPVEIPPFDGESEAGAFDDLGTAAEMVVEEESRTDLPTRNPDIDSMVEGPVPEVPIDVVLKKDPETAIIAIMDSVLLDPTTPLTPPLTAPIKPNPWSVAVLFGAVHSQTAYSGAMSAERIQGLKGRWAPAFGAEVMHRLGTNFAIGSGVHYTTYKESMSIEERSLTSTVITDSNYFQANQLTILYVIGNVLINGQEYYVTESRDTTIYTLVLATTSNTSTRRILDARELVNQVSYLEIPLLLDAHLVQGSWTIGLRGGPTIGVLSGRRMILPNGTLDGYEDLGTERFRTSVFGLTARAYLRYNWVNGWGIAAGPTWRTILGNTLSDDELSRRMSALGGMFAVSYQLK